MGFKQDARFVKVWEVENKGNYHVVSLSTSKKNQQTGEYETDFSNKFVRFIGTAHASAITDLEKGDLIKLGSCEVTSRYDKEKNTTYTNFLVYSFEKEETSNSNSKNQSSGKVMSEFQNIPNDVDEELPFA